MAIPTRIIAEKYSEYERFLRKAGIIGSSPDYIYVHSVNSIQGMRAGIIIILSGADKREDWPDIRVQLKCAIDRIQVVYHLHKDQYNMNLSDDLNYMP